MDGNDAERGDCYSSNSKAPWQLLDVPAPPRRRIRKFGASPGEFQPNRIDRARKRLGLRGIGPTFQCIFAQ